MSYNTLLGVILMSCTSYTLIHYTVSAAERISSAAASERGLISALNGIGPLRTDLFSGLSNYLPWHSHNNPLPKLHLPIPSAILMLPNIKRRKHLRTHRPYRAHREMAPRTYTSSEPEACVWGRDGSVQCSCGREEAVGVEYVGVRVCCWVV